MNLLSSIFTGKINEKFSKDEIAKMLKTTPEALETFENAYMKASDIEQKESDNLFDMNSRQAVQTKNSKETNKKVEMLTLRIVNELLYQTGIRCISTNNNDYVTLEDIKSIPENIRPQLTGHLMKTDINAPGYLVLFDILRTYQRTGNKEVYHLFRQGLDILDLDPIIYETIGMNRNSIGYWFPTLKKASEKQNFFQIPATKIVKVPLTLLQLTRCDYMGLTPTTIDIVNRWAYEAFELDENKTYFIKTGTYSSKFDFRNAKVTTSKEVRELGSYLLFIHFQALLDCDSDEVLGITPYWRSDVMKKRFTAGSDADTADMKHDYIIYQMHERKLMSRYNKNKELIVNKVNEMIPNINLTGQWSLDIMQNGDDFWLIDMATADCSALNDCIPKEKLNKVPENWIPNFEQY